MEVFAMRRSSSRLTFACGFVAFAILLAASPLRSADNSSAKKVIDSNDAKLIANLGVIELSGEYPEGASRDGLFGEMAPNLTRIIERLNGAAKDDKVSGIILEFRGPQLGRGKIAELRTAIAAVRKSGKRVYADMRSCEGGEYLLASACDE